MVAPSLGLLPALLVPEVAEQIGRHGVGGVSRHGSAKEAGCGVRLALGHELLRQLEQGVHAVKLYFFGFVFMSLGMWIYMRAAQGCGPRDALLVGLGKRFPKVPIGVVQIVLWVAVTAVGWLLGGPVGVGTLLSAFGAGAVTQLVYHVLHFEPRDVEHRDVIEVNRQLAAG